MRFKTRTVPFLMTVALAAAPAAADTTMDDFEAGVNLAGWTIGGGGSINPAGGNPGAWFERTGLDTFAPIARTDDATTSPFVGDFRDMGVTQITFDARTDFTSFSPPEGFQMSILLRDTKGTADVVDDDYAYFAGPDVPLPGEGWLSYTFEIPSASTDAVPEGWTGGWFGDAEGFRPGVDWNDVVTSVDRVEIWWIHPAFFAIFQQWDVGLDNIAITIDVVEPCVDVDADGMTGITELLGLLAAWGTADPTYDIAPDSPDGLVDIQDLLALLAVWGPCS